jgi:hypothetical protein
VVGVLLGNLVIAAVMFWVWPVLASNEMVRSLESALRHMATLSGLGISGTATAAVARPARGFRLRIFQDLAATLRLHGEAQFEPGAATPEHQAEQHRLLQLLQEAQQVFLIVAGFVRNRLNVGLGQVALPARQHLRAVALAVGPNLEAAADALAGRPVRPAPDLGALVATAEAAVTRELSAAPEAPGTQAAVADLQSQLELYRSLAPMLERLVALAGTAAAPLR